MPVNFLNGVQRASYGRYVGAPSAEDRTRYFHLDDAERALISQKRGDHNRLGFALQLTTVRFLGTFLEDPTAVPPIIVQFVADQCNITDSACLLDYRETPQRWAHTVEIRTQYGYREFVDPIARFRLTRWLYALCWTGTERPSVLFERAVTWLLVHKVLLPGCSGLERFIAKLRVRVEARLWRLLGHGITAEQRARLERLLTIPPDSKRASWLERLRSSPVMISGPALVKAIERLQNIRDLGITLPTATHIPSSRIASLARFANTSRVTALTRLPLAHRMATLVAFAYCMEMTAHDDVLAIFEVLLHEVFGAAVNADKKARLRTLKDLDRAATTLSEACRVLLDVTLADADLRTRVFARIPQRILAQAVEEVHALVRPPDNVYYQELDAQYTRIRRFLPVFVKHLRFGASPAGMPVVAGLEWINQNPDRLKANDAAPREVISKAWEPDVLREDGKINYRAYTFCVLDQLRDALRRRDVFVSPSWRYADPRVGLITGTEWEKTRPVICRTLGLSPDPQPALAALAEELDQTFRAVVARLPDNPAVRFETVDDKQELILTPFDKLEEPLSLLALRDAVAARLPRVDLPEILLEISARTGFTDAFTHLSENAPRAENLNTSLCAVLLSGACNTGPEPLVHQDIPALRRDRLSWVDQNYIRDETLIAANAKLVTAQSRIPLALAWGGGEVASADGMRFVVAVRTIHAG